MWRYKGNAFYWFYRWDDQHKLIGLRIGKAYLKIKPTADELFSERNGYDRVLRAKGWSLVLRWW